MRRREFLGKTAALAGLAGVATALPLDTLLSQAAKVQAQRARLPSPSNMPIDTIVVLMMENRSFDHYLGWHPDADAEQPARLSRRQRRPASHPPARPRLPGLWLRGPRPLVGGRAHRVQQGEARWLPQGPNDEFAIGYYLKDDVPFIPHVGERVHPLRPLLLLAARPDVPEPPLPVVGPVGRADRRTSCRRLTSATLGNDLRPRDRAGRDCEVLRVRPTVRAALWPEGDALGQPDRRLLR